MHTYDSDKIDFTRANVNIVCRGKQTKDTFNCKTVMKLFNSFCKRKSIKHMIDPFARNCEIAHPWTNDIDPNTNAIFHMDALDFIKSFDNGLMSPNGVFEYYNRRDFDLAIMNPPFSARQDTEIYGKSNLYTDPKYIKNLEIGLGNLVRPGGYVWKMGYNSNYSHNGFQLYDIWVIQYGGSINDMIISVHKKIIGDVIEWA